MKNSKQAKTVATSKKPWEKLELGQLDVPSTTQGGAGRLQPGEAFPFYRNS